MSVAQFEAHVKTLNLEELFSLEDLLRREKARRMDVSSAREADLLQIINEPMPETARFRELSLDRENGPLSESENQEFLRLVEAREEANARRVQAVAALAQLRNVSPVTLWEQMVGRPQECPVVIP